MAEVSLVMVYNSSGELLLGHRIEDDSWTLPGGHIEDGESPEDAARRETKEECGVDLVSLSFLTKQMNESGTTIHGYSGYVAGNPNLHGNLDPDGEMDKWKWVSIDGGLESRYFNNLHGPDSAEGGNIVKQLFDIKEKKDGGIKEGALTKAEGDEIIRQLAHNDPNERLMGLRLNSITPQHLQQAALDSDPNVWRAAVDHPLFDDMDLMNSPANPLEQQSYLLSKPDRAKSHYLDAMWHSAIGMPYAERSKVLDVIANHPLAEVNLIRSLFLDVNTNQQQRSMLIAHENASPDLLQYVVETALRMPSSESLELAKVAIKHVKMPMDLVNSLVKMAVDQPANAFIQELAKEALSDKFIDKAIINYLIVQNKLKPGTNVGGLIATALSGPSGKQYNVDQIIQEVGPGIWDGTQKLPMNMEDSTMDTLVQYAHKTGNKVLLQRLMDHVGFKNHHLHALMSSTYVPL
jgi:ADP-ribose pyrophosphatase YjhB (NUDIX family)